MAEYKSLYRKWRPRTFTEVYGQEHITKVLQNQILNKKVSHAYLFCGSRGTGKTTCAKILAKAVNCENPVNGSPCNECETCMGIESGGIIDVIEIDAASNNGVENIRDIREDAAFTPGSSKKKVYIIDEVHMLSIGAFNALLKTLEEPPPHIIFILATTEINKIPATILSRCQRHDFRRLSPEIIAKLLNNGCKEEKIKIEEKAVDLISRLSNGAMRDAWNILEACAGDSDNKIITFDYVSKVSGYFDVEKMVKLCVCIKDGDAENVLRIFWEMYDNSLDCNNFCASLLEMFRNIQIAKIMENPSQYINLETSEAEKIIEAAKGFDNSELLRCNSLISEVIINLGRYTTNKKVAVEMLLVEMCLKDVNISVGADSSSNEFEASALNGAKMDFAPTKIKTDSAIPAKSRDFDKYADLIEEVGKENKMITPYLKSGSCVIDENAGKITIYIDNEFKADILRDAKNIAVIQKNLDKFLSVKYSVAVELQKTGNDTTDGNKNSIDDILNKVQEEI